MVSPLISRASGLQRSPIGTQDVAAYTLDFFKRKLVGTELKK